MMSKLDNLLFFIKCNLISTLRDEPIDIINKAFWFRGRLAQRMDTITADSLRFLYGFKSARHRLSKSPYYQSHDRARRQEFQTRKPRSVPFTKDLFKSESPAPDPYSQPDEFPTVCNKIQRRICIRNERLPYEQRIRTFWPCFTHARLCLRMFNCARQQESSG